MSYWSSRNVLVTGGASFIGSHIVERLLSAGAKVRVADDFSSGRKENLAAVESDVDVLTGDLKIPDFARSVCENQEVVFHLAADHGGRGYVDLHQVACATNLWLDQVVFTAAVNAGVDKITFASSGCAYPLNLQTDTSQELYLTEDLVGPPYDPDGMYGLAKVAGELTLRALSTERGIASSSCRYFTVYGPRGVENHAVIAMIARAFIGQDPFIVWGNGEQIRNWTYVEDIADGTILAAEKIDDGSAINLGTMERVRVLDAVQMVLDYTGHTAQIETHPEMPTGPVNRVADNALAKTLLGWEPKVLFEDGLKRTIDWYFANKNRDEVRNYLESILTERPVSADSKK
ncbi:MAG: NAD-dependent epimerase/dehydratase family protein [Actinomycetota bacterium]